MPGISQQQCKWKVNTLQEIIEWLCSMRTPASSRFSQGFLSVTGLANIRMCAGRAFFRCVAARSTCRTESLPRGLMLVVWLTLRLRW